MIHAWERHSAKKAAQAKQAEESAMRAEQTFFRDDEDEDEYSDYDFDPIYYN